MPVNDLTGGQANCWLWNPGQLPIPSNHTKSGSKSGGPGMYSLSLPCSVVRMT